MKKTIGKAAAAAGLCVSLLAMALPVSAAMVGPEDQRYFDGSRNAANDFGNMGRMVISEPGDYTLTGEMRGTVVVDPGAGDVRLILDGAQLDGAGGPAIAAVSGDHLSIALAEGSRNGMRGGTGGEAGAAIFSEVPLSFEGEGRLYMDSQGPDAIRVQQGDLRFNGGDIRIRAEGSGFDAQTVSFNDGAVAIDAQQGDFAPGANVNQNGGAFYQVSSQAMGFGQNGAMAAMPGNQQPGQSGGSVQPGQQSGQQPGQQFPGDMQNPGNAPQSTADTAGEIVTGTTANSAMALNADYDNAVTYTLTDEDGTVKISESGTYVVTGSSSEGSITVKKGTTGVVLVLDDLDLTSTSGAALSINKEAEVQVIVSGSVSLTDNENPADEYSDDADVADAYDGAAIKIKANAVAFITGDGTLTVNGNAKNGIKAGDDSTLVIGGGVTVDINAVNDGINGNYDVTILSGTVNVSAGDDGIHADRILTIGADGTGPNVTVSRSTEGLEGTVVNLAGGKVKVTASDDGINAANGDGTYEGELAYSVNMTGGDVTVIAGTDGIDSNGSINLVDGSASIRSANNGGDAGLDYDGSLYISEDFDLNNASGVAGPDGMGGAPGQMGQMNGMPGGMGGQMNTAPTNAGGMGGQMSAAPTNAGGMGGAFRQGR